SSTRGLPIPTSMTSASSSSSRPENNMSRSDQRADVRREETNVPFVVSGRHLSRTLQLGLVVGLIVVGAHAARADLKLCNATSSRIGVAIGYQDPKGWATEGWWNIASQTCETLLKGKLGSRFYYVHAVDYDRGGEWGGTNLMCTADKAFTIRGVEDCTRRGFKRT